MIGYGNYEIFVTDRGGINRFGQIQGQFRMKFTWERDNIGMASLTITKPDEGCCELLGSLRTLRHELVIYRNGYRVWEGPITRIGDFPDYVEMDARDVSWYLSRRALAVSVNYTGIAKNAVDMLYEVISAHYPQTNDPFNIGPYLKKVNSAKDAKTAARHDAYTKTVHELLDKYVDDGGIDYIVRGRSIIIYDTHTRLAVLPKLSDADFSESLGVVEYGSEANVRVYTTNNQTGLGRAEAPKEWLDYYGDIERVITNSDEGDPEDPAIADAALQDQAIRSLNRGYPAPVDILVPANITINPNVPFEFQDLVPGAWVPVEAMKVCRPMQQWHRIDTVTVTATSDGETIEVSFLQAPAEWEEAI